MVLNHCNRAAKPGWDKNLEENGLVQAIIWHRLLVQMV